MRNNNAYFPKKCKSPVQSCPFPAVVRSRFCGPNARGRSSCNGSWCIRSPASSRTIMSPSCGRNSFITCRQAPHGVVPGAFGAEIATARIVRWPAAAAVKMATRSPQHVRPKLAFSILTPAIIEPSHVNTAAPTGNEEYGTYACFAACRAASINRDAMAVSSIHPARATA